MKHVKLFIAILIVFLSAEASANNIIHPLPNTILPINHLFKYPIIASRSKFCKRAGDCVLKIDDLKKYTGNYDEFIKKNPWVLNDQMLYDLSFVKIPNIVNKAIISGDTPFIKLLLSNEMVINALNLESIISAFSVRVEDMDTQMQSLLFENILLLDRFYKLSDSLDAILSKDETFKKVYKIFPNLLEAAVKLNHDGIVNLLSFNSKIMDSLPPLKILSAIGLSPIIEDLYYVPSILNSKVMEKIDTYLLKETKAYGAILKDSFLEKITPFLGYILVEAISQKKASIINLFIESPKLISKLSNVDALNIFAENSVGQSVKVPAISKNAILESKMVDEIKLFNHDLQIHTHLNIEKRRYSLKATTFLFKKALGLKMDNVVKACLMNEFVISTLDGTEFIKIITSLNDDSLTETFLTNEHVLDKIEEGITKNPEILKSKFYKLLEPFNGYILKESVKNNNMNTIRMLLSNDKAIQLIRPLDVMNAISFLPVSSKDIKKLIFSNSKVFKSVDLFFPGGIHILENPKFFDRFKPIITEFLMASLDFSDYIFKSWLDSDKLLNAIPADDFTNLLKKLAKSDDIDELLKQILIQEMPLNRIEFIKYLCKYSIFKHLSEESKHEIRSLAIISREAKEIIKDAIEESEWVEI